MHGGAQGAVDALNTLYLLSVATAASMRESCVESTSVYLIQPFFFQSLYAPRACRIRPFRTTCLVQKKVSGAVGLNDAQ